MATAVLAQDRSKGVKDNRAVNLSREAAMAGTAPKGLSPLVSLTSLHEKGGCLPLYKEEAKAWEARP